MNEVRLLNPEEAGLTDKIQIFEDGIRTEEKSGSYEWWYFDSKYADGSSLVIIFYTKHVTSFAKNFKPFVSLNYTGSNGKEIKTELWSDDYSFSKNKCDVRIGDCYIKGDLSHYDIYFKNDELESKIGDYVVVSSYIYANKKDAYKATPIFMLAKDGIILTSDAFKYLTYEEKDFVKDSYTKRYVARL